MSLKRYPKLMRAVAGWMVDGPDCGQVVVKSWPDILEVQLFDGPRKVALGFSENYEKDEDDFLGPWMKARLDELLETLRGEATGSE